MRNKKTVMTKTSLMAAGVLSVVLTAGAEIRFGEHSGRHREHSRNIAPQGQFFATTDYGDLGQDWNLYLRGKAVDKPGVLPSRGGPWTSDGNRTLFGVKFEYPLGKPRYGQVDYSSTIPLVDRAIIWWGGDWWGGDVPAPGTWRACILTTDDQLIKLKPEQPRPIYPSDRTTIDFDPVRIKTFYVGLKGREDGITNFATVRGIKLLAAADRNFSVTNQMFVSWPDFYQASFSSSLPGMIDYVLSSTPFLPSSGHLNLLYAMTPFMEYKGARLEPVVKDYPVTVRESEAADTLEYTLTFNVPDASPVDVAVRSVFRPGVEKSLDFHLHAANLPEGARIGYRLYGPDTVFGALADTAPSLSGGTVAVETPAGRMAFYLKGSGRLGLSRVNVQDAVAQGVPRIIPRGYTGPVGWVRLETLAAGAELELAITLPLGSAGQPQPEMLNYTWRPSLATGGDQGIAPFQWSDLELLEEIDCGNPDDPHVFYDATNDPALETLIKKHGKDKLRPSGQVLWGWLACLFADNIRDFAVPMETIEGQRCRVIPDVMGSYFRYDLNTRLSVRTPYLVVVEHAFDQLRRGAFYSISFDEKTGDLDMQRNLVGALETELNSGGGFKTEAVLCYHDGLRASPLRGVKTRDSIVFANKTHSGPWLTVPGLAVRRIRLYRVKTMPELPDIAALVPVPERQRTITLWTEMCLGPSAMYLFQYPRLAGYNGIMTHAMQASGHFGHNWHGAPADPYGWNHIGTLAGNEMVFSAAGEKGLFITTHLGDLLHLGFEGSDYHSFIQPWDCKGEIIPFQPTQAELDHISGALRKVMPKLARYRSLRDISMYFLPGTTLTRRNIEDFCAATGAQITPAPLALENLHALLRGGPGLVRQWQEWACAARYKFNQWLLAELQQYRPDIFITLVRSWDHGLLQYTTSYDSIPGADRQALAAVGLKTYVDMLRLIGLDPELYAGNPGFSLELEASPRLRAGKEVPDYYETDWFRQLRSAFSRGGLGMMVHCATLESGVPLQAYHCPFMAPRLDYRRELIRALLFANPRNVTIGSYNWPWGPRLADLREFAVPYRLLPFAEPEKHDGVMSDTAGQAVMRRYGDRYGLINAGNSDTTVTLELPPGKTTVTDFSEGVAGKLEASAQPGGKSAVKIAMPPWSLKTLEIK
jgi:hypothetical protein